MFRRVKGISNRGQCAIYALLCNTILNRCPRGSSLQGFKPSMRLISNCNIWHIFTHFATWGRAEKVSGLIIFAIVPYGRWKRSATVNSCTDMDKYEMKGICSYSHRHQEIFVCLGSFHKHRASHWAYLDTLEHELRLSLCHGTYVTIISTQQCESLTLNSLLENFFICEGGGRWIEVCSLNRCCSFEFCIGFEISRNELAALRRVFCYDVTADGTTLKKNEAVIILDLAISEIASELVEEFAFTT